MRFHSDEVDVDLVNPNSEPDDEVVCSTEGCGQSFGVYPQGMGASREACPRCGSMGRKVMKQLNSTLQPQASLSYGAFPEGTRSKRRRFAWGFTGWDFSVLLQRLVRKDSFFDKKRDRRYEHIEDPVTEKILKHQDHLLSEHTGHGSAKFKQDQPDGHS